MAEVVLENITKKFGSYTAVPDLNFKIRESEFITLLGPSGCGKTTTLRMVAGLEQPNEGRILIGGKDVTHVRPEHRRLGMVFQEYALFPHMTVKENINFGLRERKVPAAKWPKRVNELLELVFLTEHMDKFPHQLSGGQRQRVALARALAFPPDVLLMDEPLGALDLKLRQTMQLEISKIQRELGITTIFVTHDQEEALNLSDRIVVMNGGLIAQVGTGPEIYNHPVSPFVADFLGKINFMTGHVRERDANGKAIIEVGPYSLTAHNVDASPGTTVKIGIRPEKLRLGSSPEETATQISGQVTDAVFAGNLVRIYLRCSEEITLMVEAHNQDSIPERGQTVRVDCEPDAVMVWPEA